MVLSILTTDARARRSPTPSSGSSRGGSRSRRSSRAARRRSRSSGWPTAPARRRRSAFAAASPRPSSSGPRRGSPSTSRRPSCARRARASTCRSRSRVLAASRQIPPGCLERPRGRRRAGARRPAAARRRRRSSRPRARAATARGGSSVPAESGAGGRARGHRAGSGRAISRRRLPISAASATRRTPTRRRPIERAAGTPTSRTSAARSARGARSRSPLPGGHNLLLAGPPGIGKTMLARRLPGILPPLDDDAALEVTRIHSVAGLLPPGGARSARRRSGRRTTPRRRRRSSAAARHPAGRGDASPTGACCCSTSCRSSRGRRWRRCASRSRTVRSRSRASAAAASSRRDSSSSATMNLCPCGGRGDGARRARAAPQRLDRYRDKLSRALLDRFDLVVALPRPRASELAAAPGEASAAVRERVVARRGSARDAAGPKLTDAERAPRSRGRPAAAVGSRPRAGRPRRPHDRGARRVGRGPSRARRRGALLPLSRRARRSMTELAMAVFAASRDAHATDRDRTTRSSAAFVARLRRAGRTSRDSRDRGLRWLGRSDAGFPARLQLDPRSAARAVHSRGRAPSRCSLSPAVAIVGARACTDYGAHVARSLARELAAAGVVVVSGLARGVDGWAHRGCLEAGGRRSRCSAAGSTATIRARTPGSRGTDRRAAGCRLASTRPASRRPRGGSRRGTGSSRASPLATVVVEARERSGALITADLALEEGREVLAVPGEITSALSAGRTRSSGSARPRSPRRPMCSRRSGSSRRAPEPDAPAPGTAAAQVLAALEAGALHGR